MNELTPVEKLVLLFLISTTEKQEVFKIPSIAYLSRKTGIRELEVARALKNLYELGFFDLAYEDGETGFKFS